ncbi:uncharacterized protein LOC134769534 [Penaeus indicus]|uniref:uncharacterized protein LOC134769534 n=1 Tax=Penaeus indicus TaxID=29960 RepID=UPI00300CF1C6
MKGQTRLSATLAALVVVAASSAEPQNTTKGMELLNFILTEGDPKTQLCGYLTCHPPLRREDCPEGTLFVEGVKQFGCCGACVRFLQYNETQCTGSIDPNFGGGYGILQDLQDEERNGRAASLPDDDINIVHSRWCDYSLGCYNGTCLPDEDGRGCRFVRDRYDEARANGDYEAYRDDYRWRPVCSPDGTYEPKQCKGPASEARCFCVDPDGNTIFGSAFPEQEELLSTMNCQCSRLAWAREAARDRTATLHCALNGNFEELQCEAGWCFCIDPLDAKPYGQRIPEQAMFLLPCYNVTEVGEQYLRRCESEYHAHQVLYKEMMMHGTEGPSIRLHCDPDGSYSAEQCDYDMCRCYDRYLNNLGISRGGCKCARDKQYYEEQQVLMEINCRAPDGGEAGTYSVVQKRGGYSFCVDEDGVRAGPLLCSDYESKLDCDLAMECQKGGDYSKTCKKVCFNCPLEAYALNNPECTNL